MATQPTVRVEVVGTQGSTVRGQGSRVKVRGQWTADRVRDEVRYSMYESEVTRFDIQRLHEEERKERKTQVGEGGPLLYRLASLRDIPRNGNP